MISTLRFHNTLNKKQPKQEFIPLDWKNPSIPPEKKQVRMYVCGPTVYNRPHLGNARSVVVYDVLYRLLMHVYGEGNVTYVRNITDVDDKINAAAKERGISIRALTEEVTAQFHADMDALNVLPSTERAGGTVRQMIEPRATDHVREMLKLIEQLLRNGNAYIAQGHVLFSVKSDPGYGQLSGRVLEELKAGERIAVESYKRDGGDFVLWKPADAEDDPSSVFDCGEALRKQGVKAGRPGWHIECSAMSGAYLGTEFDIHGGGADLMFPHHENEIAQSRCAHKSPHYAHFWIHNGFLTVNGEKMSKSLGNFITVRDLLDNTNIHPEVIRYALLSTNYRSPLDWNAKLLSDSEKSLQYFYGALEKARVDYTDMAKHLDGSEDTVPPEVLAAIADDMNIPLAIASLYEMARKINKESDPVKAVKLARTLKFCAQKMLGILKQDAEVFLKKQNTQMFSGGDIEAKIAARAAAKKAKNWAEADRIRDELQQRGIILEDRPDGTTDWRRG